VFVRGVLRGVMSTYFFKLSAVSARRKMSKQTYKFKVTEKTEKNQRINRKRTVSHMRDFCKLLPNWQLRFVEPSR